MSSVKNWQGLYSFELFEFHVLPWPYQVLYDLRFSCCHFRKIFRTFLGLRYFLTLNSDVLQNAWCLRFSLSYIVLALSSAVTNLPNETLIFDDFQTPIIKFHEFPGLGNEILKFHNFPGFPLPVRRWSFQRILPHGWALVANIIFQKAWWMCWVVTLLMKPIAFSCFYWLPIAVVNA